MQPRVLEASQPITHWYSGAAGVPVHIGFRPRLRKAEMLLHMHHRLGVAVRAGLQPEIYENPVATPEGIVELLQL